MMDYTKLNAKASSSAVFYDQGLRSYMLSVYNYMTLALALTGIVALFAASSPAVMSLLYMETAKGMAMAPLGWVVAFAPLGMVLFLGFRIHHMSLKTAQTVFWIYAGVMGLSLSSLFIIYTGVSIARVFFISASVFGAMSLYGYTTKKDLTNFGSFLMMGLIGIIIASLVNIFLQSAALHFAVSILGVLIFVGLTAYDTQKIKATYYELGGTAEVASKGAIMGALTLYLDFINLFIMMLRFFGDRR
jgi:uncharacterized protein